MTSSSVLKGPRGGTSFTKAVTNSWGELLPLKMLVVAVLCKSDIRCELWFLNAMGMIGFCGAERQKSNQNSNQNSLTHGDLWHWLDDRAVLSTKIVREPIKVLFICIGSKALSLVNRNLAYITKLESHTLSINSQTWADLPKQSQWVLKEKVFYTVKNLCFLPPSLPSPNGPVVTGDCELPGWLCIKEGETIRLSRYCGTQGLTWH